MGHRFFDAPILNNPYEYPARHWEVDAEGKPTQQIIEARRDIRYVSPIPSPRKQAPTVQDRLSFDNASQEHTRFIREVRSQVDIWRKLPDPTQWGVTPTTARLLHHWRHFQFSSLRPFFCQVEAVEVAIWLTEVAPFRRGDAAKPILAHLANANAEANPGLNRLALKLATGAGKTTVMAMLIAWQTLNAIRHPDHRCRFTKGFLIVAPGLTIKDRLRVLQPNDAESYYLNRELVPSDLAQDIQKAKIVITNYHAFKLRETLEISKVGRGLIQGRTGAPIKTLETDGKMIQRVMSELASMKDVMVINDEAHHCYREKVESPEDEEEEKLKGEEREEAKANKEAARCWISGLDAVQRQLGITRVFDLSATPFFLRGSGYPTGSLFPWTMSDFSLMDAIECGIVKLPRVPVADNIPGAKVPVFRNLWEHIRKVAHTRQLGFKAGAELGIAIEVFQVRLISE